MVALQPGTPAPEVALHSLDGNPFKLKDALAQSPLVVLIFFKVGCPTCQFEFPYLERLHRSYPSVPMLGISQDDADATTAFARMYGVSFPLLLDSQLGFTVQFGLTNVPSLFVIGQNSEIKQTIVGFVKADLEALNQTLAEAVRQAPVPLFTAADEVPALKPG